MADNYFSLPVIYTLYNYIVYTGMHIHVGPYQPNFRSILCTSKNNFSVTSLPPIKIYINIYTRTHTEKMKLSLISVNKYLYLSRIFVLFVKLSALLYA